VILVDDERTIVLAGSFNPAILVPQWVGQYGLGLAQDAEFTVELITPVPGLAGMPRYSFEGISYSPGFQNIRFFLAQLDNAGSQRVVDVVHRILAQLPHSPVAGIGFNFSFEVARPSGDLAARLGDCDALLDALPGATSFAKRSWSNTILRGDSLVTFKCVQNGEEAASIGVNFHYNTRNATHAGEILSRANLYDDIFGAAKQAAAALCGEALE
jgi:hypothetical protein